MGVSMLAIVIPVITNWGLSFVGPANTEQPGCAELVLSAQPQESKTNRPHHLDLFGSPSRSYFILPHGNIRSVTAMVVVVCLFFYRNV